MYWRVDNGAWRQMLSVWHWRVWVFTAYEMPQLPQEKGLESVAYFPAFLNLRRELEIFWDSKCGEKRDRTSEVLLSCGLAFVHWEFIRSGWQLREVQWWFSPRWHVSIYLHISLTSPTAESWRCFRAGAEWQMDGCVAPFRIASGCEQWELERKGN